MNETAQRKASALRTMLEMMEVPDRRLDTSAPANIRWLNRNLRINNADHPLFETAKELVLWLMIHNEKGATTNRSKPVC